MKNTDREKEFLSFIDEVEMETENVDDRLKDSIYKAKRKLFLRKYFYKPVLSFAACFLSFVFVVNVSGPIADACSSVPILRELVEAVTFSRSLEDAVDNEYVQPIYLEQENNGVKMTVEYLIVDQKQVNIFYKTESDKYKKLNEEPIVRLTNGEPASCSYGPNQWDQENGKLKSMTIDFSTGVVPEELLIEMNLTSNDEEFTDEPVYENSEDIIFDEFHYEADYVANFEFKIKFDPKFTATGKTVKVDKEFIISGQKFTLDTVEIYPTHMKLKLNEDPNNTKYLTALKFRLETDKGQVFELIKNGIVSEGSIDSKSFLTYRADSIYFYDAEKINMEIDNVVWLDKNMDKVYVNLKEETMKNNPSYLKKVETYRNKEQDSWSVTFLKEKDEDEKNNNYSRNYIGNKYYDKDKKEYYISSWSYSATSIHENEYSDTSIALLDYPYDEVWIDLSYTEIEKLNNPVCIEFNVIE